MREKWKAFCRWHPSRLTRGQKLVRNAVCALLLLVMGYRLLGCPPLTAMHAFRQAERQNLAGPSEILARISGEDIKVRQENLEQFGERNYFGDLGHDWVVEDLEQINDYILGEKDGTLYCFLWETKDWGWWEANPIRSYLSLREKTGAVTVMPMSIHHTDHRLKACVLSIYTELPGAVSASVEVREVLRDKEQYYSSRCSGEGTVYGEGVFVIAAYQCAEPEKVTQVDYEALNRLREVRLVLKNAAGDVIYDEVVLV